MPAGVPLAQYDRRGAVVLRPAGGGAHAARARPLPDRAGRRLPGSVSRARASRARRAPPRRLDLDDVGRARLGRTRTTSASGRTTSAIARAAAQAGFDEIMFDYVRFPSDGDVGGAVYPARTAETPGAGDRRLRQLTRAKQLAPLAARVSRPPCSVSRRRVTSASARCRAGSRVTSTRSARWPTRCSTAPGSSGSTSPSAEPGETVFRTLADFRRQLKGSARAPRALDPGLGLRPRAGAGADRRGTAPGRQGLSALERRGPLHAGRAGARASATS